MPLYRGHFQRYHGYRATSKAELRAMITNCISYNVRRLQRKLGVLTPLEKYSLAMAA